MDETKILIIEDDKDLSGIMRDYLVNEGYSITQVFSGLEAVETAKELSPTLIILDIMLPKVDGIEICRKIRTFSVSPIIMISARSSDRDKLFSLGMGADDYITKPFSLPELVGRVKSHIRRYTTFSNTPTSQAMEERTFGSLKIIPSSYTVSVNEKEISLTSKEFQILELFTAYPFQVFSKEQIMDLVWGEREFLDDNTIAVYVGRLREKLAKENISCIKTVWGVGYKWVM